MNFFKNKIERPDIGSNISLTDYLTDALFVFDIKSKLVLANPKAEIFFEVREEMILGISILGLSKFKNLSPLVSLLGGEIKTISKEELTIRNNFIVEVTSIPISSEGKRTNTLVVIHDITRAKLADEMKNEFVTLAAHQLRTPTSGIKWALKSILDGDDGPLNEKQKETLEKIYSVNDKVINLVHDLLDLAEIEEGKYLNNISSNNIGDLIQASLELNKEFIIKKKLYVQLNKDDSIDMMVDKEKMNIVFNNVLDNAIRYTKPGGKIIIDIIKRSKEIEIRIRDTGIGIPSIQENRVFSKFFRGTNVMKIDTEGTGLGLYITKNIIEAHGGRIWFDSKENKGTTFYIVIPVKEKYGEFLRNDLY